MRRVALQLDYYLSSQFAGVAVAKERGLYAREGISLDLLPLCPPGDEAMIISKASENDTSGPHVFLGTCEQNVLIPEIDEKKLKLRGVAAMLVALAALPGDTGSHGVGGMGADLRDSRRVGAHVDTVELIRRLMPKNTEVIGVSREDKLKMLESGEIDAVQVYDVMETLSIEERLGVTPRVMRLEDHLMQMSGSTLGYAQVLFAPEKSLECQESRETIRAFLSATFAGWEECLRDPETAARVVYEVQDSAKEHTHWVDSLDFTRRSLDKINTLVRKTRRGHVLGSINPDQWSLATEWLRDGKGGSETLDPTIWGPSPNAMVGQDVSKKYQRKYLIEGGVPTSQGGVPKQKGGYPAPRLAVITVGENALGITHKEGPARKAWPQAQWEGSWFDKESTGKAWGVDVKETVLPESATTDDVVREIRKCVASGVDGIQLMWPLPKHIDTARVYGEIPLEVDADGAHYSGQVALGNLEHPLPVTPKAILWMMEHYGVDIKGKSCLVVGRSRLVGAPLAQALTLRGAVVTVAHSETTKDELRRLCEASDVVIPCVGIPDVLKAEWITPGTTVINVGTRFSADGEALHPDINILPVDRDAMIACCPGGVGPVSVAALMGNVWDCARARRSQTTTDQSRDYTPLGASDTLRELSSLSAGWTISGDLSVSAVAEEKDSDAKEKRSALKRSVRLGSWGEAKAILGTIVNRSNEIDHHPTRVELEHHCTEGVELTLEISTHALDGRLSESDFGLARDIDAILPKPDPPTFSMSSVWYDLPDDKIAKFPSPRGESKLLLIDDNGKSLQDLHFGSIVSEIPRDAHLIVNDSRVFDARLWGSPVRNPAGASEPSTKERPSEPTEVMLLNEEGAVLSGVDPSLDTCAHSQKWRAMIRAPVEIGDQLELRGGVRATVVELFSAWEEEGEGLGVEAAIRFTVEGDEAEKKTLTFRSLIEQQGETPIPPYLRRPASSQDTEDYQTVYAGTAGSVAAPTAGLHFTPEIMDALEKKGVKITRFTLHVSAGTFRPVASECISQHPMHKERFSVHASALREVAESMKNGRPVICVGTTSA
eukprot:CAMPEP_0167808216 /NCGR_PEP_ID=MMETSP0111_2-20121227/23050_1 /TAXON_ID=91324 /ORGANISM="Lotharella globosa, Strain CCCM811" /LENGTH=1057 /DNA_ID=CAMNT_0007706335 /DNA_START=50 /DNA_END=3221 /DNA_ORIENTATION=+